MSELNGAGGSNLEAGGQENNENLVPYETHRKLLEQRKADQKKMQEQNAKLAELEANQKAFEEQKLQEQNQWKELADKYKAELDQTKQSTESLVKSIVNAEKVEAFEQAIGAKLANPKFKAHINLDAIGSDENGNIDQESLQAEIDRFQKEYGTTLLKQINVNLPPAGVANLPTPKSYADMTPAEKAEARRQALANNK